MRAITEIEDLRRLARRRLPRIFYDYVDGGSWSETTYRDNERDLRSLKLRQRVGCAVGQRDTASLCLGTAVSMPLALAPTGLAGMLYPDGEIAAARAAQAFGVPYILPTMSICSIEDVAAHTDKPFWFQLYLMRDRDVSRGLIERARAAGCSALVLTLDLPAQGQRHKDIRNRLATPLRLSPAMLARLALSPQWCARMLRTRRYSFGNVANQLPGLSSMQSLAQWTAQQFDPEITWDDVEWVKRQWGGKLVLKGILDVGDARKAIDVGCDALTVSNHGGRQLDGAVSSIRALSEIASTLGNRIELHMDGGIRSGQDVLRALACGARTVYIGRPFLYGLAADGEAGVTQCLQILHKELDLTMAFCGLTSTAQVDDAVLF